ncbi:NUMOD3 domain-containing DNA-binding protein, partial [Enterococcus faecium]|uniref:NUMOD3 domain-containing DNA-binding protein n=1 Tax=Enterococcus faecium TaxID=1352 RepID=UPI003AAD9CE4
SKSRKGIVLSEEHKSNLSKSCSGDKHRNFGKTIPDDVKIKISHAQKGRVFTEEHKRKLSESAKKRCSKEVVE